MKYIIWKKALYPILITPRDIGLIFYCLTFRQKYSATEIVQDHHIKGIISFPLKTITK